LIDQARRPGRHRKVTVTLPTVQEARRSLRREGDPTGIRGEKHLGVAVAELSPHDPIYRLIRNKIGRAWGVGDVTPERLAQALRTGGKVQREYETFEDGRRTGLERKRIISRIEVMRQHNAITHESFAALEHFRDECDLAIVLGARLIGRYEPRMVDEGGSRGLLPAERAVDVLHRIRAIYHRWVPVEFWAILDWVAADDAPLDVIAERLFPHLAQRSRESKTAGLIEAVGAVLARIYDLGPRHRWTQLQMTAMELSKLVGITSG
jgi:hypothetical protein